MFNKKKSASKWILLVILNKAPITLINAMCFFIWINSKYSFYNSIYIDPHRQYMLHMLVPTTDTHLGNPSSESGDAPKAVCQPHKMPEEKDKEEAAAAL